MEIKRLTREDHDFYMHMGPIFGSRLIEKQTKDRFYDDAEKIWFLIPGKGAASLLGNTIKNFWAVNEQIAEALIHALQEEMRKEAGKWLDGTLPNTFAGTFEHEGFELSPHRVNFIEVYWHEEN